MEYISCNCYPKESSSIDIEQCDFNIKNIAKEGHFIIIKGSIQQEAIIVLNLNVPSNMISK